MIHYKKYIKDWEILMFAAKMKGVETDFFMISSPRLL